ncbi:MAG: PfkB family carbohydrate kinase [archaeon]|nr:PfkB family carbohydrate kinase [archaeon]
MPKVYAIGDLNTDFFTYTGLPARFGEEQNAGFTHSIGGNAANFAVAAAALGVDVSLVSMVGNGLFTKFLKAELSKSKVNKLLVNSDSPNGFSNIFVRKGGERGIFSNKGALMELTSVLVSKKILSKLKKDDVVYFGGFFHLPKLRNGFVNLLKSIRKKGAKIFFDATFDEYGKWEVKSFLSFIDIFFLNKVELEHISKTKNKTKGIKKLFSMGAKEVVLKLGSEGAEYYSNTQTLVMPALNVKPINTTGAGDFFNAGFIYALLNGFSAWNSLLISNFVAGKKIEQKQYFKPTESMVKNYLKNKNLVEVVKVKNYNLLSKLSCQLIVEQLNIKPDSIISIAAGKTPIGLYEELVKAYKKKKVSFANAVFVELDEYIGLTDEKDSFEYVLQTNFLSKVNFKKENIFIFDLHAKNISTECKRIDSVVRKKPLDFVLLGIGTNCHIAYNEPNTSFFSETHVVSTHPKILRAREQRFNGKVPARAFTLGIKTITSAKKIVLIANGNHKSNAIKKTVSSKPSAKVPASILQKHPNSTIIVDVAAGHLLKN